MKRILLLLSFVLTINVQAGVYCTEDITQLITHENGKVYFKTNKTCMNGWCHLDWSSQDQIDRAYSVMLAARMSGNALVFYWRDLESCSEINVTYASPGVVRI